jgi:predicted Zn-dependent peptidase
MMEEVQKTILKNGVRVVTLRIPSARSVSMGVWVASGARDESDSEAGLSHFIEHMIFKGTRRRSAFEIAREFDAVGGLTNAFTAMENTCFHARVLDVHLPTMADILSDIFLNSVFDESEIERERPVIIQEIGMVEDTPDEWVHVLNGQTVWGNDPLGRNILGERESVMRFDRNSVRSFFERRYRPDRILISLSGNLEHNQALALIGPAFEAVAEAPVPADPPTPDPIWRVAVHPKEIEQTHILLSTLGLSITDPDRFALSILNTILGGNMSSRLFQEIREKEGLAYSVYSFINAYRDTGLVGAYAAVAPEHARHCIDLMLEQLERLKTTSITVQELIGAKEYIRGNLLISSESVDSQMVRLAQNELSYGRHIPLDEVLSDIDAVTQENVLALAERLFQADRMAITALGSGVDAIG